MHVQVRCVRVAGVTKEPQHLTASYLFADLDAKTVGPQVRVKNGISAAQTEKDVIASECFERDRDGPLSREWDVLRQAVLDLKDCGVGDGEKLRPVAIPIRVNRGVAVKGPSVRAELDPIGGEALCDSGTTPSTGIMARRCTDMLEMPLAANHLSPLSGGAITGGGLR